MIATETEFAGYPLLLIADSVETNSVDAKTQVSPKLLSINWLSSDIESGWRDAKSVSALLKYYQRQPYDLYFTNKNSLSKQSPIELLLLTTIEQLNQYQNGSRTRFDLPLDMSHGTDFQQNVWQALQQIPYGQTISYAQLAQNIGKPTAYRAAANANGKNPFSIVVPCHRVVASGGGLGGYTGGIDKKRWLLQLEQRAD